MTRKTLTAATLLTLATAATPAVSGGDRVLWRFDMASTISGSDISVGPDGTIYAGDILNLYALNPDGSLKWTRSGTGIGGSKPVDFLADGGVVTGIGHTISVLEPQDGSTRWTFSYDGNVLQQKIEVGPSVGPDGNVYAVTGTDGQFGLGAFSLTPEGVLRWNDLGDPPLAPINASTGGPVHFTSDRLIFPFDIVGSGSNLVYGYDLEGNQTLFVDFTCVGPVRTDPLGRVLIASACGVEALQQDGNQSFWTVDLGPVNLPPVVGADSTVYTGSWGHEPTAINPDGSIRWTSSTADDAIRMLAARQDVGRLIFASGNFGEPNAINGVATDDGLLVWTVPLRFVEGHSELIWSDRAATSQDGSVVYFTTRFTSNGVPAALWAVAVGDPPAGCPADLAEPFGQLDFSDVVSFLTAFGTMDPAADFAEPIGQFDFSDVTAFLIAFGAGCP